VTVDAPRIPEVVPAGTEPARSRVAGCGLDAFLATHAATLRDRPAWQEGDAPMPALYVSHGAPPVFDDPRWIAQLAHWSADAAQAARDPHRQRALGVRADDAVATGPRRRSSTTSAASPRATSA
jgi:hypothetical protein